MFTSSQSARPPHQARCSTSWLHSGEMVKPQQRLPSPATTATTPCTSQLELKLAWPHSKHNIQAALPALTELFGSHTLHGGGV